MRNLARKFLDRLFTLVAGLAVLLMAAALIIILGPIFWRGASAVFFKGTVEYRRMRLAEFGDGSAEAVKAELRQARAVQKPAWDLYHGFARGLDTDALRDRTRIAARDFGVQMENRAQEGRLSSAESRRLKKRARDLRDELEKALDANNTPAALAHLSAVLDANDRGAFENTAGEQIFTIAETYKKVVHDIDLSRRESYSAQLRTVRDLLWALLGPPPEGKPPADLVQFRYGATRWDEAQKLLDQLMYDTQWVADGPGKPLAARRVPRRDFFEGTELAALFPMVERNLEPMLRPQRTVYLRYFIDHSTIGGLFGGIGPDLLGTLLLTVLTMLLALPVGVITAAYLVECTQDGLFIRFIRTCINTLAGVPSIVFGLFGLAFFVLFMPQWLNGLLGSAGSDLRLPSKRSILYGSLTLAILVLPIVIRASEEAIRSVPRSYKEAALSLGAGGFRTFVSVTFPAALPGILTGVILSMSRAAGETAPILFTAAVAFGSLPGSIMEPSQALPYSAYVFATGDALAAKAPHNQYGMIMSLVLLVLVLNVTAILIRSRVAHKLRGQ